MKRELERYLKQATRGLYGAARKDVWNELEQDILERVRGSKAFGLSETQALNRALEQLGDPRAVSAGMASTYHFPVVFKGLALTLIGGAALFTFSSRAQQILKLEDSGFGLPGTSLTVKKLDLQKAIEAEGLKISPGKVDKQLGVEVGSTLTLPNGKRVLIPLQYTRIPTTEENPSVPLYPVLNQIRSAGYSVEISGWNKLHITSSLFKLTLEPVGKENSFINWYRFEGARWASNGLFDQFMAGEIENPALIEGRRPDLAGKVVVAVTVTRSAVSNPLVYYINNGQQEVQCKAQQPRASAYADAVQVSADGHYALRVIGGVVAEKSIPKVPRTVAQACTPQAIPTGVFLAIFEQGIFKPLKTPLQPGMKLEPGKTYTL